MTNWEEAERPPTGAWAKPPLPWQQAVVKTALEPAVILGVHSTSVCAGQSCAIHQRTNHRMRHFPQFFDNQTQAMYRVCVHRNFHIDPDERPNVITQFYDGPGDCCGCCL
jgi:hypothetical protein